MRRSFLLAAGVAVLTTIGCAQPKAAIGTFGIDLDAMDTTVKPGDDFYRYVNGTWVAGFEMPADRARYGVFDALRDKSDADVHAIVDELVASDTAPGTTERKVADLYAAWMDTGTIEARGIEPLRPHLDAIASAQSKSDLMRLFGSREHTAPFAVWFEVDPDDTTAYCVRITQSGLGMPNRDYYVKEGERYDEYRAAYRAYVTSLFELIGAAHPAASAEQVIELETAIAAVQWEPERQRIVKESVNPMSRAELRSLAPNVDWDVVLGTRGLGEVDRVVVGETTAIRDSGRLVDDRPLDAWKTYLTFHVVNGNAENLPRAFDEAHFGFHSRTLHGIEKQRDRWKRGVRLVNDLIGEGVSELYVDRHYPPESKAQMDVLVVNLRKALATRLETLEWMDERTRAAAQRKLSTFESRVGHPPKWRDYSALTIEPGKLFESVVAARRFEFDRQLARLHQPVDRDEWWMKAQTVNAYCDFSMNQITFPAGILQPPFFDPHADPAVNYGAIGAVIGHEIGHGFDDQGREYDEMGRLRNWWSEETNARFVASTERLAAQYAAVSPLPGISVNGSLTMGENIGDLGGLQMAYTAYRLSLKGEEPPVIDGFTGDQRFFLSWTQVWRAMQRDDALRSQLLTNPHSPPMVRGSIPMQNLDAWYDAFGVEPGDAMYLPPEERVRIW